MSLSNPNSPMEFPRTEGDALAELVTDFSEIIEGEPAISDRADLERRIIEPFSGNKSPFFRRTDADELAERREKDAWQAWHIAKHSGSD